MLICLAGRRMWLSNKPSLHTQLTQQSTNSVTCQPALISASCKCEPVVCLYTGTLLGHLCTRFSAKVEGVTTNTHNSLHACLSLSTYMPACLSICVYLSTYTPACLSCMYMCVFIYIYACMPIYLSICVYLSIYMPACLPACLSKYVYLSTYMLDCLSICVSIYLHRCLYVYLLHISVLVSMKPFSILTCTTNFITTT